MTIRRQQSNNRIECSAKDDIPIDGNIGIADISLHLSLSRALSLWIFRSRNYVDLNEQSRAVYVLIHLQEWNPHGFDWMILFAKRIKCILTIHSVCGARSAMMKIFTVDWNGIVTFHGRFSEWTNEKSINVICSGFICRFMVGAEFHVGSKRFGWFSTFR